MQAEILAAANLILNEQYYLAIIIRDKLSTGSYIVLWNFTLSEWEFHQLSTSIQGSITATGVSVNAFPIPVWQPVLILAYIACFLNYLAYTERSKRCCQSQSTSFDGIGNGNVRTTFYRYSNDGSEVRHCKLMP